jgi:lipoprotein-anchoring transpeptidase ErfK/SrfK
MKIVKPTLVILSLLLAACRQEKTVRTTGDAAGQVAEAGREAGERFEAVTAIGPRKTREELEKERFDERWRALQSFQVEQQRQATAATPAAPPVAPPQIRFVTDAKATESLKGLDPAAIESLPVLVPVKGDASGPSVLRAQVYLDRLKYSPGIIDGRWGKNSEIAVYWFQRENGLPPTGDVDQQTFLALLQSAGAPATIAYNLTAEDLEGPFVTIPEDVYEQEKLECLCYESLLEELAERFHTSGEFLQQLNPDVSFESSAAGQQIWIPNVRPPVQQDIPSSIARVVVSVEGNYMHALDGAGKLLLHAPTTLGSEYDPSPTETLEVKKVTFDPWFHYQPKLFHDVPDEEPEAHLAPGPNSAVGVVWAALSKQHYGIHGTSDPDSIGYTSSHGCIRLTNWDAAELAHQLKPGVTVEFVDARAVGGAV